MALQPIKTDSANRFTALVIGSAGKGKTSLLRTIPEDEAVCVLSAESGLLCVRDLVESGRVQGFEINSWADMQDAYLELHGAKGNPAYQWIFIDSLTEIAALLVKQMEKEFPDKKDAIKMWGMYTSRMTELIKGFRDMQPYNVVFTCLDSTEADENNVRFTGPSLQGSAIKQKLPSYFDEVFYLDVFPTEEDPTRRLLITQPVNQKPAKDRSGKLNVTESPDLTAIKTKILGG